VASEPGHVGAAGASAAQQAKLPSPRRAALHDGRGRVGRLVEVIAPSAGEELLRREERECQTGAEGEHNLAAHLLANCPEVLMLHDRRVDAIRADIDHIVIAPSGVHVIDCRRYKGKIHVTSPLFARPRLKIAGRDRTSLIEGVERQVAQVRAALEDESIPVSGCLCFVAPDGLMAEVGLPLIRTLELNGYPLYYQRRLVKRLNRPGPIGPDQARAIHSRLTGQLRAAIRTSEPGLAA